MITSDPQRIETLSKAGLWRNITLHQMLASNVAAYPHVDAVVDQPNREQLTGDKPNSLTWEQLDYASTHLAVQLQQHGVGCDDTVVLQLPNVSELLVCYYALSKLGAIVSPLPVQYGPHELQHIAAALQPKALITLPHLRQQALAQQAQAALPNIAVLQFGHELQLNTQPSAGFDSSAADDANRVLTVCWTSGTTGTPKGVPRSHNMWDATGRSSALCMGYQTGERLLNPFPLVNMAAIGGFLMPAAASACTIVLHQPLEPDIFLQQMQDEKINATVAPPALLNQLAKSPALWRRYDFSALRSIASGSAPLAPWMIETFSNDYGIEIVNMYGSNEGIALFASAESAPDPAVRAVRFSPPPEAGLINAKVVDPNSGELRQLDGEQGELLVAGPTVFDGYLYHDNTDVFDDQGYFRTGDLVQIDGGDQPGYRIVGRCKDIINRGGMKISPLELDTALEQHPDLVEAAVCPYPDERLGEKICACVVVKPGSNQPSLEQVVDYLADKGFARFKLPEKLLVLDALPRNPLGKVQRFTLTDMVARQPG